jgi:acetyl-CoA carboxylase biotin carboxyl carrier protein
MSGKNRGRKESRDRDWNLEEIQELIDLLAEREIGEFEMERNGFRVRIRRDPSHRPDRATVGSGQPRRQEEAVGSGTVAAPVQAAPPASSPAATARMEPEADIAEDVFIIKSPIVGTYYAAPAPNAPPFVKLHDTVEVGQVLCIVEAMKLMNEIESEVAGEIARIYLESGQPVEYGQSLFAIQPSHKK